MPVTGRNPNVLGHWDGRREVSPLPESVTPEQETLIELNRAVADLEQRRDADAVGQLNSLISPDLIFRRATGQVVSKSQFMHDLQEPSPFASRESEDIHVDVIGSRALVTLTVVTTKQDGAFAHFRNVRVFFRHGEAWSLEVWFNEKLPAD